MRSSSSTAASRPCWRRPAVKTTFLASEHGSPDGMWTLDAIAGALAGFETGPSDAGFLCQDTLSLAGETIGFSGGQ